MMDFKRLAAVFSIAGLMAGTAHGQDAAEESAAPSQDEAGISIELNTLAERSNGCLMTFVVENGTEQSIDKASYEVVLFDGEGLVKRMTVLDFQDAPAGRTRVRQFNIGDTACDDLSRILVNDVATCDGEGVEPALCMDRLSVSSQSDVEFTN